MASSVVSQSQSQLPAASMMARVDRLDLVVSYLEEMRNGRSARSSTSPSTTLSSSSQVSCRPAEELLQKAKAKGSLVDRISFLENRVLEMEEERMSQSPSSRSKRGIKSLVKSCVRGNLKTKD